MEHIDDDSGFSNGLTAMQREVMERNRNGERVEMVTTKLADGSRKVEIREVTEPTIPQAPKEVSVEDAVKMYAADSDNGTPEISDLPELDEVLEEENNAPPPTPIPDPSASNDIVTEEWVCEMCGHKHGDPVYAPTPADKQFFVESIFGGTSFERIFEYMGGGMQIHCVAPERTTLDVAYKLLQWSFRHEKLFTADEEKEYYTRIHAAMMVTSVSYKDRTIRFDRIVPEKTWSKMETEDYEELFQKVVARIEEFGTRYPFIAMATAQFLGIYNELVVHALDENFWTGVSQA